MKEKIIVSINNIEEIKEYKKVGISTFLFALQDFCVGYEKEFTLEEINAINEENKYILINRVLDCASVEKLRGLLKQKNHIKGIFFEDVAVYQLVKKEKLSYELIAFQNHFGSNVKSIDFWLQLVESVVICNELTKKEIEDITRKAIKPVVLQVFGYNQIMYSRRLLLSNFCEEFHLKPRTKNVVKEKITGVEFKAYENMYGTVLYSSKIFNGLELMDLDNVKYFYINSTFLSSKDILNALEGKVEMLDCDTGFLTKATIYKLRNEK